MGQDTQCSVPAQQGVVYYAVGTVDSADAYTNYSADLTPPLNMALLTWVGGTFESPDIAGFYVFMSPSPGNPIDYQYAVANINAYTAQVITDGYGMGTYGGGTYGYASASYSWTTQPLESGVWSFAVTPYDLAGNLGTPQTGSITIQVPPAEIPVNANGQRLTYTLIWINGLLYGSNGYGNGVYPGLECVLNWLPTTG